MQRMLLFPFQCPGGTFTPNMKSTKDYPDEVINFMRNHPAMHNTVYPVHKRPLVVRTNVDYEFTTITVDQVAAADGNYEVLFLGTGECFSKSAITLCVRNDPWSQFSICGSFVTNVYKWSQSEPATPLIRVGEWWLTVSVGHWIMESRMPQPPGNKSHVSGGLGSPAIIYH